MSIIPEMESRRPFEPFSRLRTPINDFASWENIATVHEMPEYVVNGLARSDKILPARSALTKNRQAALVIYIDKEDFLSFIESSEARC